MFMFKPVTLSQNLINSLVKIERECYESGNLSWGPMYDVDSNWFGTNTDTEEPLYHIPVASNGIGQMLVLMYMSNFSYKVFYPENTFEGIKRTYEFVARSIGLALEESPTGLMGSVLDHETHKGIKIFTPIGGYLRLDTPKLPPLTLVDAAHGHFLGLEKLLNKDCSAIVYSFFATKTCPVGEGGLIVTKDRAMAEWLCRVLMYDNKNGFQLVPCLNARVSQATALKIREMMSDKHYGELVAIRNHILSVYEDVCNDYGVSYINDDGHYKTNGYKFIITDPRVTDLDIFHTSPVFNANKFHHVCPATYNSVLGHFRCEGNLYEAFASVLENNGLTILD